jgi:hypothetical protein
VDSFQAKPTLTNSNSRVFQRVKDLSSFVCHEKAKLKLGSIARRLFGRLERAMTINVIYQIFKVIIYVYLHYKYL